VILIFQSLVNMDPNLKGLSQDDLLELIRQLIKKMAEIEAELLRLKKIVQGL
jgi:hypothetical protein